MTDLHVDIVIMVWYGMVWYTSRSICGCGMHGKKLATSVCASVLTKITPYNGLFYELVL